MSFNLAVVLGFLFVSAMVLWALLSVGKLVRMRAPNEDKLSTYECGERPFGSAWFNFNNRFYVIALVFVAFDVQVALAVPVVVVLRRLLPGATGALALGAVFAYLGVMMLTLAYVWRHGDLSWIRELAREPTVIPHAVRPGEAAETEGAAEALGAAEMGRA